MIPLPPFPDPAAFVSDAPAGSTDVAGPIFPQIALLLLVNALGAPYFTQPSTKAPGQPEALPGRLVPFALFQQDRKDPRPKKRGGDSVGIRPAAVAMASSCRVDASKKTADLRRRRRNAVLRRHYRAIVAALNKYNIEANIFDCKIRALECTDGHPQQPLISGPGKKYKFIVEGCGSRLCPFCSRRLAAERVADYALMAKTVKHPRFLTLSGPLIPYGSGLKKAVQRRRKSVKALLRAKVFASVTGGIQSFELTMRKEGFNLHTHLLVNASWIENRTGYSTTLEETWKRFLIRRGEPVDPSQRVVVWVQRATEKVLNETLKYTIKGAVGSVDEETDATGGSKEGEACRDATSLDREAKMRGREPTLPWDQVPEEGLRELVDVLEGQVHLVEPFGDWRGRIQEERARRKEAWKSDREDDGDDRYACVECGKRLIEAFALPISHPWFILGDDGHWVYRPPPDQVEWQERGYAEWMESRSA